MAEERAKLRAIFDRAALLYDEVRPGYHYNIGLFTADGIAIRSNRATNGKDLAGIFVNARSTGNLFRDNRALGNERLDCWDRSEGTGTSGTANTWIDNIGETDRPSGICNAP
jgi:hypothetical protein